MISATQTGLSGMQTAQARLDAAAHQIAQSNTRTSGVGPAVAAATGPNQTAAAARPERLPAAGAAINPDVARAMVEQRSATYDFASNLHTVRTSERMMGALLNTRA